VEETDHNNGFENPFAKPTHRQQGGERHLVRKHQLSIHGVQKDHRTTDSPFQGHNTLYIIEHLIWSSTKTEITRGMWFLNTTVNLLVSIKSTTVDG
jgi:hypothetical protein